MNEGIRLSWGERRGCRELGQMELWKEELNEEDASFLGNTWRFSNGYVLSLIARLWLMQHSKVLKRKKTTQSDRESGRASEARGLLGRFHHHA